MKASKQVRRCHSNGVKQTAQTFIFTCSGVEENTRLFHLAKESRDRERESKQKNRDGERKTRGDGKEWTRRRRNKENDGEPKKKLKRENRKREKRDVSGSFLI